MSLRPAEKQTLYYELAQLVHAGIPLGQAIRSLLDTTRTSRSRKFLATIQGELDNGCDAGEAFAAAQADELETAIVATTQRSGHLEEGFRQLARHFEKLNTARHQILGKLAYPAFLLHFGVLVLALPTLITGGGLGPYLIQTLGFLLCCYAAAATVLFVARRLDRSAASSSTIDSTLAALPVIGPLRRSSAIARFCAIYRLQLDAGVNVISALGRAASTSHSARLVATVDQALPALRAGESVSTALSPEHQTSALPVEFLRALKVGEDSGTLDETLQRLEDDNRSVAARKLDTLAEWFPRAIYLLILGYLGGQIVATYSRMLSGYSSLLDL